MMKNFVDLIRIKLDESSGQTVNISNTDLKEALDEIGKDLIYNYFIFGKGVSYETFFDNLRIYINILNIKKN